MKKIFTTLVLLTLLVSNLSAGGFQINENGARAMSMANAFTGLANDVSAVYWNSAGIIQLKGTHIMGGVTFIFPEAGFRGPAPEITEYRTEDALFYPVNFYFSHQINDDLFVGFGMNNPFGLGTTWDKEWVGKYLAINTEIRTFNFYPVVTYQLMEGLAVSAGATISYADVTIERKTALTPFQGDAFVSLEGDATAFGFNGAVYYQPTDELSFGASFHSEISYDFEGTANTSGPDQLSSQLPGGNVTAPLTTPMNLGIGAAYRFDMGLTLSADFQYIGWSSYDELVVDFEDPQYADLSAERNYENAFIVRFGGEYMVTDKFAVRGGIYYDKNPVPDEKLEPTLPDADRIGLNLGLGYDLTENLSVDLSYLFIRFNERTITNSEVSYAPGGFAPFNGTYNSNANLFGIDFSYKF